tara:strand:- start:266 stop:1060 length:795 start_codon:yes stop_codon:yes gene_type:complete
MASRVVIKLGGGLITDKGSMKKFDYESVQRVVESISLVVEIGVPIIIVHGAGSFGHLLAKEWSISEGLDQKIAEEQRMIVKKIRSDMRELNRLIITRLAESGLEAEALPPSEWAIGTGSKFQGEIINFQREVGEPIPITFGDVVNTNDELEFGVLSGDDLMLRLARELEVSHCIFLIGDAEGVLSGPPDQEGSELIDKLETGVEIEGPHYSEIDVTGGIGLKIDRARKIASDVGEVWILDGRCPERIVELLRSGETRGTKILPY